MCDFLGAFFSNCGNNKMLESDWFLTALIYCLIWLVQHQTVRFDASNYGMVWYGMVYIFKVANVGSGCPISRARGSCYKRATITQHNG